MRSRQQKRSTSKPSTAKWKDALKRLERMQGQMGLHLFDRLQLAIDVFNDQEFRAGTGNVDDSRAARFLDGFFPELFFDHPFDDLRAVLEMFPRREDWAKGQIQTMWQEVVDRQSRRSEHVPKQSRRVISRKEYEQLEKRYQRALTQIRDLKEENAQLRQRLLELETQTSELAIA